MRNVLILFSCIIMIGCSTLHNARKSKMVFDEKQFIESCKIGRNHDLIKDYIKSSNQKLVEIKDTELNLNAVELAVFPYLIPCDKSNCIKSDIDIWKCLEIFIETRPEESEQICNTAIKGLIKHNSYLYVPRSFNYLVNLIGGQDKLYRILEEDKDCKERWNKGWKSCFEINKK